MTSRNLIPALLAAGSTGVALLAVGNYLPFDVAVAIITFAGVTAFAAFDYSRRIPSLRVSGQVLRPIHPAKSAPINAVLRRAA